MKIRKSMAVLLLLNLNMNVAAQTTQEVNEANNPLTPKIIR